MDESAIKGQESLGEERLSTISVEGYETRFHHQFPLSLALTKHFAKCGKIARIFVPRDRKGILRSPVFIYYWGEGARDKALKLSGRDLGGWTAVVKPVPQPKEPAELRNYPLDREVRELMVKVEDGLPSSVRDIDYMIGLYEHFSSCGEVTDVSVIPTVDLVDGKFVPARLAEISIMGKGCVQKALELSGRNAQGWNLVVRHVAPPSVPKRQRTGCEHPSIVLAKMEKAEMEKAKKMGKGKKKKNAAE